MNYVPNVDLNSRISDAYLIQQRAYHDARKEYGTTSSHYASDVQGIIEKFGVKSVLDYGCGKGHLKQALGDIVTEYDPAIPGKDAEPKEADLVVCTDVLEHIEPDKLDSVLEHIRRLGKYVFLIVATRPANKNLPDGRNAHLIIEDAQWWRNRISLSFDILTFDVQELGFLAIMKPYILVGEINGVGVMKYEERLENIKANIKVTKERVRPRKLVPWVTQKDTAVPMFGFRLGFDELGNAKWGIPIPHNRVAIVMCYGPSLQDTWSMAIEEKAAIGNADIVSVSGAHDFIIEHGIVPRYHVECDPRKHKGDMIAKKHPKVVYLMASCCHPEVVAKVAGPNLKIWHMNEGDQSLQILEFEPNEVLIPGGGSVGLRSIPLLYMMGYRRFIIHGMDCSYRDDQTHAGPHTGKKTDKVEVRCTDQRKFITAPVLITYKRYFDEMRRDHVGDADKDPTKIEIILRGDGLLQHWLRVSGGASGYGKESEAA